MKTQLIMTITCPDQPGIVERITAALQPYAANWEESQMARLGGDFAGIVKISVATEQADDLVAALESLGDAQTTVTIKKTAAEETDVTTGPREVMCDLALQGADHEGIVHKVAAYLAQRGINVEAMETKVVPAPMSAAPLFQMRAHVKVPPNIRVEQLRTDLVQIGDELGVDIQLSEATSS